LLDQGSLAVHAQGERIGIIGGTFDPVHYAHLAIAEEVYHALKLTRVIFVPAGQPPHKAEAPVTPADCRLAMLKLAIAGNPHFALSLVDLQRSGPSYTVDTLRLLRQELGPRAELYFVLGGDSLKDLPTWHDPEGLLAYATIVALMRPGYGDMNCSREQLEARLPALRQRLIMLSGPLMEISSTDLRRRVAEGWPIKYQLPEAVERYISRQGLYRNAAAHGDRKNTAGHKQGDAHAANAI
jgi:nicotinate-nucleotide adenylyltransferase